MNLNSTTVGHLDFRLACKKFPTGVTILTTYDNSAKPCGITVSSFTSVSLEPPLVLACIGCRSQMLKHLAIKRCVGVNVLSEHQRKLSEQFAKEWQDRFVNVNWYPGHTGVPLLVSVSATFECEVVQVVVAGDHFIVIGQVLHVTSSARPPLVYVNSSYNRLGCVEPERSVEGSWKTTSES